MGHGSIALRLGAAHWPRGLACGVGARPKCEELRLVQGRQDSSNRVMNFAGEIADAIVSGRIRQWPGSENLHAWADEELLDGGMVVQPLVEVGNSSSWARPRSTSQRRKLVSSIS